MQRSLMNRSLSFKDLSRHLLTGISMCAAAVLSIALTASVTSAAPVVYVTHLGSGSSSTGTIDQVLSDGTTSTFASGLARPMKLAADAQGNIYYTEQYNKSVRKIDALTHTDTAFNINDENAELSTPEGMTFDTAGNLYVANSSSSNKTIVKYTPGGGTGTVFYTADNGVNDVVYNANTSTFYALVGRTNIYAIDSFGNGSLFASGLSGAFGLALNSAGELFTANANAVTIVKFAPDGTFSSVAYTGSDVYRSPRDLAFDADDNLYIANAKVGNDTTQGNVARFVWNASTSTYEGTVLTSYTDGNTPYGLLVMVPEPASLSLVALGGLLLLKRRRQMVR